MMQLVVERSAITFPSALYYNFVRQMVKWVKEIIQTKWITMWKRSALAAYFKSYKLDHLNVHKANPLQYEFD